MVSFDARSTLIAARILLFAAASVPFSGLSETPLERVAVDDQRQRVEQMVEEIREHSQEGPYSADLIDPLATLGLIYREQGDHALAAEAIDRALQVVRANYGLRSLEQAPLIRQSVDNEEARGNLAAAWELEQKLLELARRHPSDLRTVPILREVADNHVEVLGQYIEGEFPRQIVLGGFYGQPQQNFGSRGTVIRSILSEVWRNYLDAIGVLLNHQLYSSDELSELETELLHSAYRYADRHSGAYQVGRQSLRRVLSYDVAKSEPLLNRADAFIRIADWDLIFERKGLALELYEQAYAELRESGVAQAAIESIFSPPTPVVLPTFVPNPLVSVETAETTGYIDVAFEVTKYGTSQQIKILNATTNTTDAAKDRLARLILRSKFRPRMMGDEIARSAPIVMRYYLNGEERVL